MNKESVATVETTDLRSFLSLADAYAGKLGDRGYIHVTTGDITLAAIATADLRNERFVKGGPSHLLDRASPELTARSIEKEARRISGKLAFIPVVSHGGNEISLVDNRTLREAFKPETRPKTNGPGSAPTPQAKFTTAAASANVPPDTKGPRNAKPEDVGNILSSNHNARGFYLSMGGRKLRCLVEPTKNEAPGLEKFETRRIAFRTFHDLEQDLPQAVERMTGNTCIHVANVPPLTGINNNILIVLASDALLLEGPTLSTPSASGSGPSPSPRPAQQPMQLEETFGSVYGFTSRLKDLSEIPNVESLRLRIDEPRLHGKPFIAIFARRPVPEIPDAVELLSVNVNHPLRAQGLSDKIEDAMLDIKGDQVLRISIAGAKGQQEANIFIAADEPQILFNIARALASQKPPATSTRNSQAALLKQKL